MSREGRWWTKVDGRVLPQQVADHPALELVNTRAGWGEPWHDRQEYLRDYPWLITLARINGLLTDADGSLLERSSRHHRAEARAELSRARALRADLHDVLTAQAGVAAEQRLTQAVSAARSRQTLARRDGELRWGFPGRAMLADPMDGLLISAGTLLTSPDVGRVRVCPGTGCGWLFLDGSGRRRWCQMAVCGNRAKQARHLDRTRHAGG